ncbi:RHS repeat-associated core domain-containing protein [Corallococcus terminator]
MMPAAKHLDPLLGIDIHIVQPPGPVPPIPIPHPHIGMVFDPMDYVPVLGATVLVGGLPRAQAGSSGTALPPHIPMGGVFIKPPANESEVFMGSSTVSVDGDAFSHLALPVLSCQDLGMPPIPRLKKKKTVKSLVLPTTMVLAIPLPVLVGGPPTVSLMALGMRAGMAMLGALLSKLKKMRAARKAQNGVHCNAGHPVDVITGANFDEFVDARSAPPGLFCWRRRYTTAHADRQGVLGWGFRHAYQHTLHRWNQSWRYEDAEGRVIDFAPPRQGERETTRHGVVLRLLDGGDLELSEGASARLVMRPVEGQAVALPRFIRSGQAELELRHEGLRLCEVTERVPGSTCRYRFVHDSAGRMTEVLRLEGRGTRRVARYEYDAHGHLVLSEDAEGGRHVYQYDEGHRWTRMRTPTGYSFWWRYDVQGRCEETSGEDGLWWARFEYDPVKRETRLTERQGGVSVFQYDDNLTLRKQVDPYGGVLERAVDVEGRVLREVDSGGRVTRWEYDAQGVLVGRLDPYQRRLPPPEELPRVPPPARFFLGQTPSGFLLGSALDALPQAATGASRALLSQVPEALRGELDLLVRLRREGATAPRVSRTHDALGRVLREVDAAGRSQQWRYDLAGNEVWHQDADGRVRERRIGRWNLVMAEVDRLGNTTKYGYGPSEQPTRVADPGGNVSTFDYDEKDRIIRVWRHGVLKEQYTWDAGDRLVEKRDGHGAVLMRIEHTPSRRLAVRHLASGGRHVLAYDERGWPTSASTEAHDVRLQREDSGTPRYDLRDGKGVTQLQMAGGRRTLLLERFVWSLQGSEGEGGQRLIDPTGGQHLLWKDPTGLVLREHANGTRELLRYDDGGRLLASLRWRLTQDGMLHSQWVRFDYTAEGDLAGAWDSVRGETRYTLDAEHRLVREDGPQGCFVYAYDPSGNLLAKPGLLRVSLQSGNRLAAANDERFVHDHRNHVVERHAFDGARTRYAYDSADMLVRIDDARGEPWTAAYDALGRRIRCGRGAAQTWFHWEGERLAAEVSPEGRLRAYGYAAHDAIVPIVFVDYDSVDAAPALGRVYTVFSNQAGVPCRVEDDSGRGVWWATSIEPYGQVHVAPESELELCLRLPGQYHDVETGLFYNRFRYYDPVLGRYLQSDPLGLAGGLNLYAYPANPLVHFDVLGLQHSKRGKANHAGGNDPVEALDVSSYGDQTKRSVPYDQLQNDHIPSFAACREAVEKKMGRELEDDEARALKNYLTSISEPDDVHRQISRTYGGKNNADQIAMDAGDLREAARKDMAAIREELASQSGKSLEEVDAAFTQLDARNEDIGLYEEGLDTFLTNVGLR